MGCCDFVSWCISGLLIGALARLLMPGTQPIGCLPTILLGVCGSIVGGAIGTLLLPGRDRFQPGGWIMSIVGAVLVLWLLQSFGRPPAARRNHN